MRPWMVLPSCLLCACAAPDNDTEPDPDPVVVTAPPVDDGGMCGEDIDEAQCAINACTIGCYAAVGIGCVGVAALCAAGDFISAGGATVPCVLALAAACGLLAPSGATSCAGLCGGAS